MARKAPSFRDIGKAKPDKAGKSGGFASLTRRHWWTAESGSDEEAELVAGAASAMSQQNQDHELANLRWMRLYSGVQSMAGMLGFTASAQNFLTSNSLRMTGKGPSWNVIQSLCDTALAKIGANTSRPLCRTTGGDYKMQRKAKELNRFLRGMFEQVDAYHMAERAFLDGTIQGTGVLHVSSDKGEIKLDRVWINELMLDEADAMSGNPRTMIRRRFVPREILMAAYPGEKAGKISDVALETLGWRNDQADLVLVLEAWHLPSKRGGTDGRHVMVCGNVNLFSERWNRMRFPFAFSRWVERQVGFWGQGIAERQLSIQVTINKVLQQIDRSHELISAPHWWVKAGSKINKNHLNNEIGGIGVYQDVPPVLLNPAAVDPSLDAYLDKQFAKAYALEGMSEMSVNSTKPAGLDSQPGLETYHDIESERFREQEKNHERFIKDIAELLIEEAIYVHEQGEELIVNVPGQGYQELLDWSDIDLSRDEYVIQIEQTAQLPDTLAGKLQLVQTMAQTGVLDPTEAVSFMELGDTSPMLRLLTAGNDDIMYVIDKMTEGCDYEEVAPQPQQALVLGVKLVTAAYLRAKDERSGIPAERREMMLQWLDDAQAIQGVANGPPAGPQGAPQAQGEAAPVSALLPTKAPPGAPAMGGPLAA